MLTISDSSTVSYLRDIYEVLRRKAILYCLQVILKIDFV